MAPSSLNLEKKKTKRRLVRKSKESASDREVPTDSLNRLRDESEEEEEASELMPRVRSGTELPQTRVADEEAVVEASEPGKDEAILPRAGEVDKETTTSTPRAEKNVPKDALGVIDLSESPSFTDSMINEAQMLKGRPNEGPQRATNSFNNFFDGLDSTALEDVTDLDDLRLPKKMSPSGASVLHHEIFLRYREELNQHEAETQELIENRDAYKLLSVKLQAKLEVARKEPAYLVKQVRQAFEVSDDYLDTVANDPNPQAQKKLNHIEQLRAEVNTVKAEAEEWKKNMDRLASEKETAHAQLASTEVEFRAAKEKTLVQAKKIEELQSLLNSAVTGQENLAKDLDAAKLEVVVVMAEADDRVAQHKADAEVTQDQARNMVKHAKWQSRREAFEGVHAWDFDLLAEIGLCKEFVSGLFTSCKKNF
ncbi:WEB family protein At5g55860-like [Nicotiana tomentosiformis]|uniref:WEB family protein At5g55860-like n=1 Tax=Nicotiana tomentosiformis TaxID=4098 RepID=UPI00388C56BA